MNCLLMIYFLFLLIRAHHSISLDTDTLNQGDIFNSSSRLISKNKLFTLGFTGGRFLVINYTQGADFNDLHHPLWSANRDNPVPENSGSLTIDQFGSLKINPLAGDPILIYSSKSISTAANVTAVLQNDGNFVLKDQINLKILWESFDHPTDTLLPGMKLGINHRNGRKWLLTSWLGKDNPSPGAFTLEWEPEERQLIVRRRGLRFWTSGVLSADNMFDNIPLLDNVNNNYIFKSFSYAQEEYLTYSLRFNQIIPSSDQISLRGNISRWFLDYRGNIQDGQGRPMILFADRCDGNSTNMGCKKWESLECRKLGDKFIKCAGNFDPKIKMNLSFSDCKDTCWRNCDCTAFYNDGDAGCSLFFGPCAGEPLDVVSGSYSEPRTGLQSVYIIRPAPPPPPSSKTWIVILTTFTVGPTIVLGGMFWYLRWRKLKQEEKFLEELLTADRPSDANELEDGGNKNQILKMYTVTAIRKATNSFSWENKLGEGGFGPVYKGKFQEGDEIAVKRLSRKSGQGLVEFKNELLLIAKLQHMNLVRLLGFCIKGEERLLVYEYLPNKSLDSFIFDPYKRELLGWNKRLNIIEGIAEGLLYLHKYSRLRIIHRDLKASNILLDKDMNPKISDFGMARIFRPSGNEENTKRIVGTYGYMSPEYAMNGIFSVKSDVYSFGVLLLEIVSGKRNQTIYDLDRMLNLVGYAWELWKEDAALELVDPLCDSAPKDEAFRCINVGFLCVEQRPEDRPTMSNVLSMLASDGKVELPIPKQPAFCAAESSTGFSAIQEDYSHNSMSFTDPKGR